jgi:hypothetical protein
MTKTESPRELWPKSVPLAHAPDTPLRAPALSPFPKAPEISQKNASYRRSLAVNTKPDFSALKIRSLIETRPIRVSSQEAP